MGSITGADGTLYCVKSGLVYIALRLKTSYFHHFIPHHFCTGKYNLVSCSDVARSNTPCMGFKPPYIFRNTVCVYYYYLCYFNLCTSREAFYICFWTCINCRPPPPPPPPLPKMVRRHPPSFTLDPRPFLIVIIYSFDANQFPPL